MTLTNTETGVTTTQVTNETGVYNFASVPPGTYRVTASLPGFKTSVTNGVLVGTAAQVRLDLMLEVGTVDSTVEVTVSAAQVMTESSASVGDQLSAQPCWTFHSSATTSLNMVKILPGFRAFPQFDTPGVAVYAVFAGQTSDTVNITRDGLSPWMSSSDAATQIQIPTRGGTDQFNRSVVWNIQNTALNANTWANNKNIVNRSDHAHHKVESHSAGLKKHSRRDLTYGGPIRKNKTFFFVAWDQQVSRTRALQTNTVFTDAARRASSGIGEMEPRQCGFGPAHFPGHCGDGDSAGRGLRREPAEAGVQSGRHSVPRRHAMLQRYAPLSRSAGFSFLAPWCTVTI